MPALPVWVHWVSKCIAILETLVVDGRNSRSKFRWCPDLSKGVADPAGTARSGGRGGGNVGADEPLRPLRFCGASRRPSLQPVGWSLRAVARWPRGRPRAAPSVFARLTLRLCGASRRSWPQALAWSVRAVAGRSSPLRSEGSQRWRNYLSLENLSPLWTPKRR